MTLPAAAPGRAGKALAGRQSRVRLHEVGPRLELEIVKVGVWDVQSLLSAVGRPHSTQPCLPTDT